jgi:hypothetical protein
VATTKKIAGLYRFSSLAQHWIRLIWINQSRLRLDDEYKTSPALLAGLAVNAMNFIDIQHWSG